MTAKRERTERLERIDRALKDAVCSTCREKKLKTTGQVFYTAPLLYEVKCGGACGKITQWTYIENGSLYRLSEESDPSLNPAWNIGFFDNASDGPLHVSHMRKARDDERLLIVYVDDIAAALEIAEMLNSIPDDDYHRSVKMYTAVYFMPELGGYDKFREWFVSTLNRTNPLQGVQLPKVAPPVSLSPTVRGDMRALDVTANSHWRVNGLRDISRKNFGEVMDFVLERIRVHLKDREYDHEAQESRKLTLHEQCCSAEATLYQLKKSFAGNVTVNWAWYPGENYWRLKMTMISATSLSGIKLQRDVCFPAFYVGDPHD